MIGFMPHCSQKSIGVSSLLSFAGETEGFGSSGGLEGTGVLSIVEASGFLSIESELFVLPVPKSLCFLVDIVLSFVSSVYRDVPCAVLLALSFSSEW